jgi:hypothetical protein
MDKKGQCHICGEVYANLNIHMNKQYGCLTQHDTHDLINFNRELLKLIAKSALKYDDDILTQCNKINYIVNKNAIITNKYYKLNKLNKVNSIDSDDEYNTNNDMENDIKNDKKTKNNNIIINNFEAENKKLLINDDNTINIKFFNTILEKKAHAFKEYITLLYCNPDFPENQCLKITSITSQFCNVYRNNRWELDTFFPICLLLLKQLCGYLQDNNFMANKYNEDIQELYLDIKAENTKSIKQFTKYIERHIKPLLYNIHL